MNQGAKVEKVSASVVNVDIDTPKFLETALQEPTKEFGRTIRDIFSMVFSKINHNADKLRIKQAADFKGFESDINRELNKIPEENVVEPKLSSVGSALEASKFYI